MPDLQPSAQGAPAARPPPPFTPLDRRLRPLCLALQGGGAHGAYTWGVLDALLEARRFRLDALSGTSAGAMNAVVLAQGWTAAVEAGRSPEDGAREALQAFWLAVAAQAPIDWGGIHGDAATPALSPAARLLMQWTQLVSPYQLGALARHPLQDLLAAQVDFELLVRRCPIALHVAATQANTGRLRVFSHHGASASTHRHGTTEAGGLTPEAVLASACLPTLMPAVMIDGEPYWDGGYSANPPLLPLVQQAAGRLMAVDVLIVRLAPARWGDLPTGAAEIRHRAVELAFNAAFLREAQVLAALAPARLLPPAGPGRTEHPAAQAMMRGLGWLRGLASPAPRWHLIAADLGHLASETKLIARRDFLEHLRDEGRAAAQAWLAQAARHVGIRSGIDIGRVDA